MIIPPEILTFSRLASPLGVMLLLSDPAGRLRALDWEDYEPRLHRLLARQYPHAVTLRPGPAPEPLAAALAAYFDGELEALEQIAVETGGTAFQKTVWTALRQIPAGQTVSYGMLAQRIGLPRAVRAVGLANGANPIGIAVPCHRVIGANGSLTGYGGGLERKRWLLAHETRR